MPRITIHYTVSNSIHIKYFLYNLRAKQYFFLFTGPMASHNGLQVVVLDDFSIFLRLLFSAQHNIHNLPAQLQFASRSQPVPLSFPDLVRQWP